MVSVLDGSHTYCGNLISQLEQHVEALPELDLQRDAKKEGSDSEEHKRLEGPAVLPDVLEHNDKPDH